AIQIVVERGSSRGLAPGPSNRSHLRVIDTALSIACDGRGRKVSLKRSRPRNHSKRHEGIRSGRVARLEREEPKSVVIVRTAWSRNLVAAEAPLAGLGHATRPAQPAAARFAASAATEPKAAPGATARPAPPHAPGSPAS